MKRLKAIIEIVRGLLVMSIMGLFLSLIFTAFWIYKRHDFNASSTETIHQSLANAYTQLGFQALKMTYRWVIADVVCIVLTVLFGLILRNLIRIQRERQAMM